MLKEETSKMFNEEVEFHQRLQFYVVLVLAFAVCYTGETGNQAIKTKASTVINPDSTLQCGWFICGRGMQRVEAYKSSGFKTQGSSIYCCTFTSLGKAIEMS